MRRGRTLDGAGRAALVMLALTAWVGCGAESADGGYARPSDVSVVNAMAVPPTATPNIGEPTAVPTVGMDGAAGGGALPPIVDTGDAVVPMDMLAFDPDQPIGSEADYHDPGTGEWQVGTPEECLMDTSLITGSGNLAVYRYGLQCHIQGGDTSGSNFSATKTLGGVLAGRAAYLVKDVARTGPGTGPILHEDKAVDWLGSVTYNGDALLSHVMSMTAFNGNLAYGSKRFSYDTLGTREITDIVDVAMVAVGQLQGVPTSSATFMREEVFAKLGMSSSSWGGGTIGTGWSGTLSDMGRLGTMLAHDGWYGGERFMERRWVYRMSHPAHEDANTSYGQLAWLNHRGNAAGIGGDIASGSNSVDGDPCAPAAFWPEYPHAGSEAPDCRATAAGATCEQQHDVGVFSAQGLGGQFIVVHPGLDMVIVAHNFSNRGGPMGMWETVRPAVVAMDPVFPGDEAAFCEAYGSGDYAPDLIMPRHPDL